MKEIVYVVNYKTFGTLDYQFGSKFRSFSEAVNYIDSLKKESDIEIIKLNESIVEVNTFKVVRDHFDIKDSGKWKWIKEEESEEF